MQGQGEVALTWARQPGLGHRCPAQIATTGPWRGQTPPGISQGQCGPNWAREMSRGDVGLAHPQERRHWAVPSLQDSILWALATGIFGGPL